jgi:hypothetical protein
VSLVRLIVPAVDLLRLHESIDSMCAPHLPGGPYPHAQPGRWTPHVTLSRRLPATDLPAALTVIAPGGVVGAFAGLRRWDGDARVDTLIT